MPEISFKALVAQASFTMASVAIVAIFAPVSIPSALPPSAVLNLNSNSRAMYSVRTPDDGPSAAGAALVEIPPTSPVAFADARWPKPCEAKFQYLAATAPDELLADITSGKLGATDLTFAAEYIGSARIPGVSETLLRLLSHPSPLVREGAVYGLGKNMNAEVAASVRKTLDTETSPGVRLAIVELLESA